MHWDIVTFRTLNQRLQATVRSVQPASAPDLALQEWGTKAKKKVAELQKENDLLKEMTKSQSMVLAARGSHCHLDRSGAPVLPYTQWEEERADDSSRSTARGRIEWTERIMSITPSWNGARHHGALCWSCHGTIRLYPVFFSSGWMGKEPYSFARPVLRVVQHDSRATPRNWLSNGD